jgi:integrase/recombinase XerD
MGGPSSRVSRVLMTGPLAPFADAYRAELCGRGYTALTTVNSLRQIARLSRWLEGSGLTAADLSGERVEQFLAVQRAEGRRGACSRPVLMCLLDVLGGLGVLTVAGPVPAGSPRDLVLAAFERYLLGERGLATGTAAGYARHARRFMEGLEPSGGLAGVTASEVTGAVLRESAAVSVSAASTSSAGCGRFCGSASSRGSCRPTCPRRRCR